MGLASAASRVPAAELPPWDHLFRQVRFGRTDRRLLCSVGRSAAAGVATGAKSWSTSYGSFAYKAGCCGTQPIPRAEKLAPPTIPAGVAAVATSCSAVSLTWTASIDPGPGGAGLGGYNVYRNGVFVRQVLAPATSM